MWRAFVIVVALAAACRGAPDDGNDTVSTIGAPPTTTAGDVTTNTEPVASRCPVDALLRVTEPVRISFWHGMTANNETVLSEMTADYNASQDRVEVELTFQGGYDEISDKYITALRGDDLPALIQLEETRLQLMIDSESVLPAGECVDASGYDLSDHLAPVLDQATVEGVLWAMPFNISSPVLYLNRAIFQAAGLDPDQTPSTFDELRSVSDALVTSGAAEHGLSLILAPDYVEQWMAMAGESFVDNDNGRSGRATEATFDSPAGVEIYELIDGMLDDGLALSVGRNVSGLDHMLALTTGDAAMTIASSAQLGSVYSVLDSGQFPDVEIGVAPLPGPSGGGVQVGGAYLYLVDKGSSPEEKAAAWDFARWLNEPEQQARWHVGTGYIPVRISAGTIPEVTELWAARPGFRVAYDQLLAAKAAFGGPVIGAYGDVREQVTLSLERMTLQDQTPTEAVATAAAATTMVIQAYNSRVAD